MIASAHFSAGLVSGMAGPRLARHRAMQIVLAFLIGIASHVVLDAIPHSDYLGLTTRRILPIVVAEVCVIMAIGAVILRKRVRPGWPWPMVAGIVGATILDFKFAARVVLPRVLARQVAPYGDWVHRWFHAGDVSLTLGTVTQIVTAVLLMAALFAFPRNPPSTPG